MDKPKVILSTPKLGERRTVSGAMDSQGLGISAPEYIGDINYEIERMISPQKAPGGLDTLVAIERKPQISEVLGEAIPGTRREIAQFGVLTASQRGASGPSHQMRSSVLLLDEAGKMAGNPVVVGGRAPDEIIRTVAQEVKGGALSAEHAAAVALGGARAAGEEALLTKTPALEKAMAKGASQLESLAQTCLHYAKNPEGLLEQLSRVVRALHA